MNTLMEKVRSHRDSILLVAMSIKPDKKCFLSLNIFLFCSVSIYVDIPYFVFIAPNIYKWRKYYKYHFEKIHIHSSTATTHSEMVLVLKTEGIYFIICSKRNRSRIGLFYSLLSYFSVSSLPIRRVYFVIWAI